jgi:hypothetical protein
MKAQRIRWIGNIVKIDKERMVTRITEWRPTVVRRIGRTKLQWNDDVREDPGKIKIQNWSKMALDREARKRILEQARTHTKKKDVARCIHDLLKVHK